MAELRRHPLSSDWVVVCPEKAELLADSIGETCIYCPGREHLTGKEICRRDGTGAHSEADWSLRVVADSLPLFHVEGDFGRQAVGICDRMEAIGAHEIVVEGPAHGTEFEDLDLDHVVAVLDTVRLRVLDLANDTRLKHVMAFKVRTVGNGAASQHPRWHIVSAPFVPGLIKQELNASRKYFAFKERCVLCDYVLEERRSRSRVICEDTNTVAISPYAARVPFEVWVLPLRHSPDFGHASQDEIVSLARILKRLTGAVRRLPGSSGYMVMLHTAPFRRPKADAWKTIDLDYHWHIEIDPCVSVLNGLIESGGFHLNPVSPEEAAATLAKLA